MRKLLLGAAAISLSGCSFLGIGGHSSHTYGSNHGSWGQSSVSSGGCNTHPCLSRWNVEGGAGITYAVDGTAIAGTDAVDPLAAFTDVSMQDAYKDGQRFELGTSYAMSPDMKLTGMGFIETAESSGAQAIGTYNGAAINASVSDYEAKGVELGLRKYFAPRPAPLVRSVRPYVEGRIGATYIDEISMTNTAGGGLAAGTNIMSESDWVASAAGLIGIETPLTRFSTIGLETGIRYTGAPKDNNVGPFAPAGQLEGVNNGGSRTAIPIMLRGRYRF